ncbi:Superkiller protein 3 [Sporothrix curviconia]|uniref:Superkiller protein 3 n=1 Tax=Sporothrix curviconia TaxID=1260050 RepID=A0ABP0ANM9_9PEZI
MAGPKKPGSAASGAKAQLKAIGEALKQQKFDEAVQQARDVLEADPKSYQALIFLGFALDKSGKLDEAVPVYEEATRAKPGDAQGWQGLIQIYEKQGAASIPKYKEAALQLALVFRDAEDLYKCQGVVDKFVGFARSKGDSQQVVDALGIILPDSPIYTALVGRVPAPAATYETIARLVEQDEQRRINTLIGERRTRLGARLVDVTIEVKSEVFATSPLTHVYSELINWTRDDDLRHEYEEKLLAYRVERLAAFSGKQKEDELHEVVQFAKGMVIIKQPFQLAWDIAVDWEDHAEIRDWDAALLWEYRALFPESGLGKALAGFMTSDLSPFPGPPEEQLKTEAEKKERNAGDEGGISDEEVEAEEGDESKEDAEKTENTESTEKAQGRVEEKRKPRKRAVPLPTTDEERFALLLNGVSESMAFLACRMLSAWYQNAEEHLDNIDLLRKALKRLTDRKSSTGMPFQNTEDALTVSLGTSLIHHQTPHNHPEAKKLFENVLEHNGTATIALIGMGLIAEEEVDYDAAISFSERALEQDKHDLRVRSEAAWVHTLKGNYEHARTEFEACIPLLVQQVQSKVVRISQPAQKLLALTQYRMGVCLWNLDTSRTARKDRNKAYRFFLSALKNDLNLAPAYTNLGVFYADYGKDRKRAFKCFMKAIELSDGELEAGRRLVQTFADKRDWESIELVAQRIVDSGLATPPWGSKKPAHSWPFAALGTAQLHRKEYNKAMMSFRMATRLSQDDYHSFVALAETYLRARMHYSAVRAIDQARRIEEQRGPEEGYERWFTDYLLGNIYRGVGEHDKAIALYESILATRPDEEGVLIALMHAMAESAESCIKTGLFGEAVSKATDTLAFAGNVPVETAETTFGFWTAVASACSVFSTVQGKATSFPAANVASLVTIGASVDGEHDAYKFLQETDRVGTAVILAYETFSDGERVGVDLTRCLHATILAYKRALHVTPANDNHMRAVAHYNLGWAEYRAHTCLPEDLRGSLNGYLRAAIRCFKRAIEIEAGNRKFWNALGVATSAVHAPVAQHAFSRSLFLGRGRASVWANLGTLALLHDDAELANQAFAEGQAADPDYAPSWLGQGFVALQFGEAAEARSLFLHAMDLSDASSLAAREQYAISLFDHLVDDDTLDGKTTATTATTDLARPLVGLEQVRRLQPQQLAYAHLFALYRERIPDKTNTATVLEEICTVLEADFEATESVESLKRVAVAKADLARAYVAMGRYADAIECSEMALQLVDDSDGSSVEGELPAAARNKVRLSANLASGLARYFGQDFDGAVADFEAIFAEGGDADESTSTSTRNPDVVCLFAQVLWASGREDARQRAQDELFAVIEAHPDHVQAILLLGVVALLNGDAESAEAVVAELVELEAGRSASSAMGKPIAAGDQANIGQVLHTLANPERADDEDSRRAARSQAQRDIMLHPHLPHGWTNLAEDADEDEDEDEDEEGEGEDVDDFASDMALRLTLNLLPPRGTLGPEDLAQACVGTRRPADAQVAIFAAPWLSDGWQALAEAVS